MNEDSGKNRVDLGPVAGHALSHPPIDNPTRVKADTDTGDTYARGAESSTLYLAVLKLGICTLCGYLALSVSGVLD